MGVTFGNQFAVVCHNKESATVVKTWIESQRADNNQIRLPEAFSYDTPVYGLKQYDATIVFESGGYGTYDTVAFTPVHEHIKYFVSMVESRQAQEVNYVQTVLHYDIWEAHNDPESTSGYHRNDPESLYYNKEYCDWYNEPEWDDDDEDTSQKQLDEMYDNMIKTFRQYANLPIK